MVTCNGQHAPKIVPLLLLFVFSLSLSGCINATKSETEDGASTTTTSALLSSKLCQIKANADQCNSNPAYMLHECSKECYHTENFAAIGYFKDDEKEEGDEEVKRKQKSKPKLKCVDLHEDMEGGKESCDKLAAMGECATNPAFMLLQCAKSCFACVEPK